MGEGDEGELVKAGETRLTIVKDDDQIVHLREEIEAKRERIRSSIDSLQDEFEEIVDWQGWVRENPWKTVGIAFAVGFLWGSG